MTRSTLLRSGAGALCLGALVAAGAPGTLSGVSGGLWEVSGHGRPVRVCAPDPAVLAVYEHRNSACKRTLVRDNGRSVLISYSCSGGAFGQSEISLVTPRSLSIQTQGIADGAPYKYLLEARRVGDCPTH